MKQLKDFIARKNINKLRYADDTILMTDGEGGTKEPLNKGERWEWKSWLKTQYSKKWISWHPVLSLHGKKGEKWKQWQIFFLSSKIVVDGDCSHQIKRGLLLGRKAMTNLVIVLKQRCHFADKSLSVVFPVVMYGWESWTIKQAEHQRTDAFELWC